jgi:hypothetical protein
MSPTIPPEATSMDIFTVLCSSRHPYQLARHHRYQEYVPLLTKDADVTGRDSHGRWGSASRIRQLGRLNALTGCRRELAVIYGQARAGAIGWRMPPAPPTYYG